MYTCKGKKLQPVVLAVQILDKSIIDVTDLSIEQAVDFFAKLPSQLNEKEMAIAKQVLKEINERLGFLKERRAWLPFPFKSCQNAFRRRSPENPPSHANWQQPDGRHLYSWTNPASACTKGITRSSLTRSIDCAILETL